MDGFRSSFRARLEAERIVWRYQDLPARCFYYRQEHPGEPLIETVRGFLENKIETKRSLFFGQERILKIDETYAANTIEDVKKILRDQPAFDLEGMRIERKVEPYDRDAHATRARVSITFELGLREGAFSENVELFEKEALEFQKRVSARHGALVDKVAREIVSPKGGNGCCLLSDLDADEKGFEIRPNDIVTLRKLFSFYDEGMECLPKTSCLLGLAKALAIRIGILTGGELLYEFTLAEYDEETAPPFMYIVKAHRRGWEPARLSSW